MSEQEKHNNDKQFMIECLSDAVVQMLVEDYDCDISTAMHHLYTSDTYRKLEDERTGLYYQSAVYLYDTLKQELDTKFVEADRFLL